MAAYSIKLLLLVFSSVLTLMIAELGVRFLAGSIPSQASHHQLLCEHDPLLGWRKIANAEKRYTTAEYDIFEQINAKGLRGDTIDYAKPERTYRVLVLGDSFTEGYTVEQDEVFTEVLKRDLQARWGYQMVEVVNGGTGGYSTDQELLFFRGEGRRYDPDLVILAFVDNDVWFNAQENYPRAPKPLFRLQAGELVVTNSPVPEFAAPANEPAREKTSRGATHRLRQILNQHSALYRFVRDRAKGTHWIYSAAIRVGLADPIGGDDNMIAMPDQWKVFMRQPTSDVIHAWTLTEMLLSTLRDEVELSGAQFMVINIPPSFDLYQDDWSDIRRRYGLNDAQWNSSAVERRLAEVCARNRIDYYDLTPAFADAIDNAFDRPDPFYFPIDGHWTASGHRFAGQHIAQRLAEQIAPPVARKQRRTD